VKQTLPCQAADRIRPEFFFGLLRCKRARVLSERCRSRTKRSAACRKFGGGLYGRRRRPVCKSMKRRWLLTTCMNSRPPSRNLPTSRRKDTAKIAGAFECVYSATVACWREVVGISGGSVWSFVQDERFFSPKSMANCPIATVHSIGRRGQRPLHCR
jgi:hypothetical protein